MATLSSKVAVAQDKTTKFLRSFYSGLGLITTILLAMIIVLLFAFVLCNAVFSFKTHTAMALSVVGSFAFFENPGYVNLFASITALAALSGPTIAYYWSMRQNERNKINLSYEFLKEWREGKVPESMYLVYAYFDGKDRDEVATQIFDYTKDEAHLKLKRAIRTLLNFFESIATACHEDHIEDMVIRRYFGNIVINYYLRLKLYILTARREQGIPEHMLEKDPNGVYYDFTRLAKRWMKLRGLTEPS